MELTTNKGGDRAIAEVCTLLSSNRVESVSFTASRFATSKSLTLSVISGVTTASEARTFFGVGSTD